MFSSSKEEEPPPQEPRKSFGQSARRRRSSHFSSSISSKNTTTATATKPKTRQQSFSKKQSSQPTQEETRNETRASTTTTATPQPQTLQLPPKQEASVVNDDKRKTTTAIHTTTDKDDIVLEPLNDLDQWEDPIIPGVEEKKLQQHTKKKTRSPTKKPSTTTTTTNTTSTRFSNNHNNNHHPAAWPQTPPSKKQQQQSQPNSMRLVGLDDDKKNQYNHTPETAPCTTPDSRWLLSSSVVASSRKQQQQQTQTLVQQCPAPNLVWDETNHQSPNRAAVSKQQQQQEQQKQLDKTKTKKTKAVVEEEEEEEEPTTIEDALQAFCKKKKKPKQPPKPQNDAIQTKTKYDELQAELEALDVDTNPFATTNTTGTTTTTARTTSTKDGIETNAATTTKASRPSWMEASNDDEASSNKEEKEEEKDTNTRKKAPPSWVTRSDSDTDPDETKQAVEQEVIPPSLGKNNNNNNTPNRHDTNPFNDNCCNEDKNPVADHHKRATKTVQSKTQTKTNTNSNPHYKFLDERFHPVANTNQQEPERSPVQNKSNDVPNPFRRKTDHDDATSMVPSKSLSLDKNKNNKKREKRITTKHAPTKDPAQTERRSTRTTRSAQTIHQPPIVNEILPPRHARPFAGVLHRESCDNALSVFSMVESRRLLFFENEAAAQNRELAYYQQRLQEMVTEWEAVLQHVSVQQSALAKFCVSTTTTTASSKGIVKMPPASVPPLDESSSTDALAALANLQASHVQLQQLIERSAPTMEEFLQEASKIQAEIKIQSEALSSKLAELNDPVWQASEQEIGKLFERLLSVLSDSNNHEHDDRWLAETTYRNAAKSGLERWKRHRQLYQSVYAEVIQLDAYSQEQLQSLLQTFLPRRAELFKDAVSALHHVLPQVETPSGAITPEQLSRSESTHHATDHNNELPPVAAALVDDSSSVWDSPYIVERRQFEVKVNNDGTFQSVSGVRTVDEYVHLFFTDTASGAQPDLSISLNDYDLLSTSTNKNEIELSQVRKLFRKKGDSIHLRFPNETEASSWMSKVKQPTAAAVGEYEL